MPKTITLHDVKPMTFCIKRREIEDEADRIVAEVRFRYLDENGDEVTEAAEDWVRVELEGSYRQQTVQFMADTVIPFLRERKGLT